MSQMIYNNHTHQYITANGEPASAPAIIARRSIFSSTYRDRVRVAIGVWVMIRVRYRVG